MKTDREPHTPFMTVTKSASRKLRTMLKCLSSETKALSALASLDAASSETRLGMAGFKGGELAGSIGFVLISVSSDIAGGAEVVSFREAVSTTVVIGCTEGD